MFTKRLALVLLFVTALWMGPEATGCWAVAEAAGSPALEAAWSRLPLRFEANEGQVGSAVLFVSRGPGFNLSLTPEGASLLLFERQRAAADEAEPSTRAHAVDLRLVGGSGAAQVA